ncbi:hypothetical protein ONA70_30940 [Micromonospora yasonensis]|uniref:hypothetical protein n=1 Tax=Micromonospora yasonensis TaxID=1128667 RepID=UPI0022323605|nr:hypothetical protein [Micromonospora yasonensis]MCW3844509.1 hypothetical protein [Micromonospora yasonensis]
MGTEPTLDGIDSRSLDRTGSVPPALPGHQRLLRVVMAVAIVGGPPCYDLGGVLSPSIHESGQASIAASLAANPVTDTIHLVAFVLASYLLPIGAVGLAYLAYPRTPWLATVAGLLAVVGWLPFSGLTALDDLIRVMADMPNASSYSDLLDRFSTDAVMTSYLLVYVVGHLVAYVLFGIALRRAGVIPRWAAWSMIASSPLTIIAFALPVNTRVTGAIALSLLVVGSIPAARAILAGPADEGVRTTPAPARPVVEP